MNYRFKPTGQMYELTRVKDHVCHLTMVGADQFSIDIHRDLDPGERVRWQYEHENDQRDDAPPAVTLSTWFEAA